MDAAGYSERLHDTLLRTQMDAGPAKQRRRSSAAPTVIAGSITVPAAQVPTFEAFFNATLAGGSLPFEWAHPRTGALKIFRFMQPPEMAALASGALWRISMQLELFP